MPIPRPLGLSLSKASGMTEEQSPKAARPELVEGP